MINQVNYPSSTSLDVRAFDYYDCFKGEFLDAKNQINSTDIGRSFFTTVPSWIKGLFVIRNKIVSLFGLKTSDNSIETVVSTMSLEPSTRVGLFKILFKSQDEIILGEEDKHLDFKVALLQEVIPERTQIKNIYCITVVKYNNFFGKIYFFLIKPFHKIIVKRMMSAMIKELES